MERLTPEEWERRCASAGPRLAAVLQRRATVLALKMQSRAVENATTRPRSRSGRLRQSIAGRVVQTGRVVATVEGVSSQLSLFGRTVQGSPLSAILSAGGRTGGKNTVYARLQDQGGTIRPVRRKWLALPDDSIIGNKDTRQPIVSSPRLYPGKLWFHLIRDGSGPSALAVLLERVGGENVARWWLRKETEVPATGFARRAWWDTRAEIPRTLGDALDVAFRAPGSIAGEGSA